MHGAGLSLQLLDNCSAAAEAVHGAGLVLQLLDKEQHLKPCSCVTLLLTILFSSFVNVDSDFEIFCVFDLFCSGHMSSAACCFCAKFKFTVDVIELDYLLGKLTFKIEIEKIFTNTFSFGCYI